MHIDKTRLLAIVLLGLAGYGVSKCASAEPLTIVSMGLHLGSYHEAPGFNNVNPGAYVRTADNYLIGGYLNSYERPTVYVARDLPVYGPFSVAVGGATGYHWAITPLVVPTVRLGAGFNLSALPRIRNVNDGYVLHLSVERKF